MSPGHRFIRALTRPLLDPNKTLRKIEPNPDALVQVVFQSGHMFQLRGSASVRNSREAQVPSANIWAL